LWRNTHAVDVNCSAAAVKVVAGRVSTADANTFHFLASIRSTRYHRLSGADDLACKSPSPPPFGAPCFHVSLSSLVIVHDKKRRASTYDLEANVFMVSQREVLNPALKCSQEISLQLHCTLDVQERLPMKLRRKL
jgi:hypothetical protein